MLTTAAAQHARRQRENATLGVWSVERDESLYPSIRLNLEGYDGVQASGASCEPASANGSLRC